MRYASIYAASSSRPRATKIVHSAKHYALGLGAMIQCNKIFAMIVAQNETLPISNCAAIKVSIENAFRLPEHVVSLLYNA